MLNKNLFAHLGRLLLDPGQAFRKRYEAFRSLLEHDEKAHELMAELEEYHYRRANVGLARVEARYRELSRHVKGMIRDLKLIDPLRDDGLEDYYRKLDAFTGFIFQPPKVGKKPPYTLALEALPETSLLLAGGKAHNLGVMAGELGLPTPKGFVITTGACNLFLERNGLRDLIDSRLAELDMEDPDSLESVSKELHRAVAAAKAPEELAQSIRDSLENTWPGSGPEPRLALRSSAAAEDSETSFAGQYLTMLNLSPDEVPAAYPLILAGKYTPQAIAYRVGYGLSDRETPMAVIALEMVEASASGVMYTRVPDRDRSEEIGIHCVWGLGEMLVSGRADPEVIRLSKEDPPRIMERIPGGQETLMEAAEGGGTAVKELTPKQRESSPLDDENAQRLAAWGLKLERRYGAAQDIEWSLDRRGKLYLLQTRPLNLAEPDKNAQACDFSGFAPHLIMQGGQGASAGAGAGPVFKPRDEGGAARAPKGAVLVARQAPPGFAAVMGRLSAVVTETGSPASHLASVAREFGVPMLVNLKGAVDKLESGREITVYACGSAVYDGLHPEMVEHSCLKRDPAENSPLQLKLRYMVNFISPLGLTDPEARDFAPHKTRSLHDILRYCHERAVRTMFTMGEKRLRKGGSAKKLISGLPMLFYVLDVGGGIIHEALDLKEIGPEHLAGRPMLALFKGLMHPDITWGSFTHFNWEEYDRIVMAGGIISAESAMLASYAVVSGDYLNLNLRFGYHFVILDAICSDRAEANHIRFRFAGGGAGLEKRSLRAEFLRGVLGRMGFEVSLKSDLVDASLSGQPAGEMEESLDILGRLLGATRLMDMYMEEGDSPDGLVGQFMAGRYDFARVSLD